MRTLRYLGALAPVLLLASCYDYSTPNDVVNGAVVITQQNASFDYTGTTHYYLDPTANVFDNSQTPSSTVPIDTGAYAAIGQAIDQNMAAAGFTKVPWPSGGLPNPPVATPHTVGIKVSMLKGTVDTYYPGYWCDYWYYYNCYYTPSYVGSYNPGTMIVEMGDLSTTSTSLPIAWLAAVYGVAGTTGYNVTLATQGINRAFGQSPYLYH